MKKLYPKLFLVLFSTLFSVVSLEIALRYISFGHVGDNSTDLFLNIRDRNIGYVNTPNLEIVLSKGKQEGYLKNYTMNIKTDARGYRVFPEYEEVPSQGRGIFGIGDSVMFGSCVHGDQTFLAQLMLRYGVPTINLGVSGYNTKQEWHFFQREKVTNYQPRQVILSYCLNDIELITRRWDKRSKTLRVIPSYEDIPPLFRSLEITCRITDALASQHFSDGTLNKVSYEKIPADIFYDNISFEQKKMVTGYLKRFQKHLAAADASFLVLVFPRREQFAYADLISEEKMATDWLSGWLQQHGIPFLNIADVFKTHNWEEMFHDSTHPTPKGHAVIAKAVYPLINH